jgi:hypothetical protein
VRSDGPPATGEGGAAAPPEEDTEAVSCGEADSAIAARHEAAGCREAVVREGEALTGVGGGAGPSEPLAIVAQ